LTQRATRSTVSGAGGDRRTVSEVNRVRAWTLLFFGVMTYLVGAIATAAIGTISVFGLFSWFQYVEPASLIGTISFLVAALWAALAEVSGGHDAPLSTSRRPE
jgi:hypothetical protein